MAYGNRRIRRSESGMSMIELMMAMTLLAVGMAGTMILFSSAIASNNRNKLDTTATVLSQMMLERLSAAGVAANTAFTITDCQSNSLTVNPTGSTSGNGAAMSGSDVDFSTAPTPATGYSITYQGCSAAGATATYNIRWNVKVLQGTDMQPLVKQIVVSTRQIGAAGPGANQLKFFAPPVTLRTVIAK